MAYDRNGNWVAEDVQSPYNRGPSFSEGVSQMGRDAAGLMLPRTLSVYDQVGRDVGTEMQRGNYGSAFKEASRGALATGAGVVDDVVGTPLRMLSGQNGPKSDYQTANTKGMAAADAMLARTTKTLNNGNYTAGGDGSDIRGAAARNNPNADPMIVSQGGLKGKQIVNTYDPDRPASMGNPANDPWKDMARQLATFSALRRYDYEHHPEWSGPRTGNDEQDAIITQGRMRNINQQGINDTNLAVEGARGDRQLENTKLSYGLQGRNQELHDERAATSARGLELLKQSDPKNAAYQAYLEGQGLNAQAAAKLHGVQTEAAQRALDFDKTADASIQKWMKMYLDAGIDHETAKREALKAYLGSQRAAKYADGGQVETPEQVMARIQAKYGVSGAAQPAPQPQAAPAPKPQAPAPQQPQTWAEKLRNVATGGLDRRMQGYAMGGPIDVSGRQVLGEGTPKSDSLPAIIDGEHPAALSTEEFVMPVETVRHFGLAKLNKMVEQSRKGLDTNRKQA